MFSLRSGQLVPILHSMGGSAAEIPTSPDEQQPGPGLRASDAERDQVVAKLRDEYVAGRLSHDTFLHRVNVVLESRQQAELPPLVADLPRESPGGGLVGWLRGTWSRVSGAAAQAAAARAAGQPRGTGPGTMTPPRRAVRSLTTSMTAAPDRRQPFLLQFPRGGGDQFSIGRDAELRPGDRRHDGLPAARTARADARRLAALRPGVHERHPGERMAGSRQDPGSRR